MKPSAFFLDTSILVGQGYNFSSTVLTTFVPLATDHELQLLLPDVIEREVKRHLGDLVDETLKGLSDVRRKAPFLNKWAHFPNEHAPLARWEAKQVALQAWEGFLKQFHVTRLGYEDIDLKQIMGWYDRCAPPFGQGKKRKEFPDAFALAALEGYAKHNGSTCIAVVSLDNDLKNACDRYPFLLYFNNLPRLTELLLRSDTDIERVRQLMEQNMGVLTEQIDDYASDFEFYIRDERYRINRTKYAGSTIIDIQVIGVGDNECTFTFEGSIEAEHQLCWMDWGYPRSPDEPSEPWERDDWVIQEDYISGVAKLRLDLEHGVIGDILLFEFDTDRFEITKRPRDYF